MDISSIEQHTKEFIMKEGRVPPALFVEIEHSELIIINLPQLEVFDSVEERTQLHFLSGRKLGQDLRKKRKKVEVTGVCQVVMCWYNFASKDSPRPSRDPHRKEGLSIACANDESCQENTCLYEIIRSGGSVDLMKFEGKPIQSYSVGLAAFFVGFRTANLHESDARHDYRRLLERFQVMVQKSVDEPNSRW